MTVELSQLTEDSAALLPFDFETFPLDELWARREEIDRTLRVYRDAKTAVDAELTRRFRAAHPDFTEDAGGTKQIPGQSIYVKMGWSKDYLDPTPEAVQQVLNSEALTPHETHELITWKPVVSGRAWNALARKGGEIAELIAPLRRLKTARPTFEVQSRQ